MSDEVTLNDGFAGPPGEKPVFNPKQEKLSTDLIAQKVIQLGIKIVYFLRVGMKRHLLIKKPDGKEFFRLPFTIALLVAIFFPYFLGIVIPALMTIFLKWKFELEPPKIDDTPGKDTYAKEVSPPISS